MLIKTLIFCVLVICVYGKVLNIKEEVVSYRLPKNVKPIRYNVTIIPNFQTNRFSGTVSIEIEALEDSKSITINYYMIDMPTKEDIAVKMLDSNETLTIISAGPSETPEHEFFKIDLVEELRKGIKYTLTFSNFSANFRQYSGIIGTNFVDADGVTRPYIFTHFQPTSARAAFPCFDEPALRAKFNIRLVRPNNNFISAANTPMISQGTSAPFEDVFEETVSMPTYLVSFTISEMKFSEPLDRCRIIAKPQALIKNQHKYALNMTEKVLRYMEEYTEVPFTLSKLDSLATIGFGGGMENWGLIVYHERYLLEGHNANKARMVSMITHEVAHQWFGNLIGLTWWEYVWLSEGFATYFHTSTQDKVEPLIDGRGLFLNDLQLEFIKDMKPSSRPLNYNREHPGYIQSLFDDIAYQKGAAILHMLENALSTPIFRKGVQYYVKKMQFKQVTPLDLYESLQRAADESLNSILPQTLTVADIMSSWDSVNGFPVVNVIRSYGTKNNSVRLTQKKYVSESEGSDGKWVIPINFATSSDPSFEGTVPQTWMTETEETISLPNLLDNEWLVANKKETSYYRVNYDEKNWELITQALLTNHLDIHVLNRAQLIDDSLNLAKTGRLNLDIAMKLDYNFNITKRVYEHVGFEEKVNDSPLKKDLRSIILNLLCTLDHPDCISKSFQKFKQWQTNRKSVSELDQVVLCTAIRVGNQGDFYYLFNLLQKSDSPNLNFVKALSCNKNPNNLHKLLKLDVQIPINDVIETVADSGPEGLDAAIDFVAKNFVVLEERLQKKFVHVLRKLCDRIYDENQLYKIQVAIRNTKYSHLMQPFALDAGINLKSRGYYSKNVQHFFTTMNVADR